MQSAQMCSHVLCKIENWKGKFVDAAKSWTSLYARLSRVQLYLLVLHTRTQSLLVTWYEQSYIMSLSGSMHMAYDSKCMWWISQQPHFSLHLTPLLSVFSHNLLSFFLLFQL